MTDIAPGGRVPWSDHQLGRSAWREAGSGRPLVFLHGLGGTRGSWNPQLRAFAPVRRCLAWDMPGYGAAPAAEPLTYGTIADRLIELFDNANVDSADVVGLSFGGMQALHAALRHGDRIERLVLANTSPAFGMDGTDADQWKASRLVPIDNGETPATIAGSVLDAIAGRRLDPPIRQELIEAFARIPVAGFRQAVACLPSNDVRSELARITCPALVIAGELDRETPVSYAEVLASGLPNGRLEVLAGVGHLSPSEDPTGFNRLVADFLDLPLPVI